MFPFSCVCLFNVKEKRIFEMLEFFDRSYQYDMKV